MRGMVAPPVGKGQGGLREEPLALAQGVSQGREFLERKRLRPPGGAIPTRANAGATVSVPRPSSRREFSSVLRRWAKAARTVRTNNASSATRRERSFCITRRTTAEPTSGRGRKQLAATWNAREGIAEYWARTDRMP